MKSLFFLASLIILNSASNAQVSGLKTPQLSVPHLRPYATSHADTTHLLLPISILDQDCATHGLPFFCRHELAMDKRFQMQLRFRVGSIQQTDWLEQKPGAPPPR